ncbi:hypothetical protein AB3S75_023197 [Citrus x aurantiifolia]
MARSRRKKRAGSFALNVEKVVEFWKNLLEEKPLLPFVIPLVLLLWVFERWFFSFSNWVPLAIAVWATVQASHSFSFVTYFLCIWLLGINNFLLLLKLLT